MGNHNVQLNLLAILHCLGENDVAQAPSTCSSPFMEKPIAALNSGFHRDYSCSSHLVIECERRQYFKMQMTFNCTKIPFHNPLFGQANSDIFERFSFLLNPSFLAVLCEEQMSLKH